MKYWIRGLPTKNGGQPTTKIIYDKTVTSQVTDVTPYHGTAWGGEEITFTGSNFNAATGDVQVWIDGISCHVKEVSSTSITCITGDKTDNLKNEESIIIWIKGVPTYNHPNVRFFYGLYF